MNDPDRRQLISANLESDLVCFRGNHKICVGLRILQSTLPYPLRVIGLYPCPMIALVDDPTKGNTSLLQGSNVVSRVHEQGRIPGKLGKIAGKLGLKCYTGCAS